MIQLHNHDMIGVRITSEHKRKDVYDKKERELYKEYVNVCLNCTKKTCNGSCNVYQIVMDKRKEK